MALRLVPAIANVIPKVASVACVLVLSIVLLQVEVIVKITASAAARYVMGVQGLVVHRDLVFVHKL